MQKIDFDKVMGFRQVLMMNVMNPDDIMPMLIALTGTVERFAFQAKGEDQQRLFQLAMDLKRLGGITV